MTASEISAARFEFVRRDLRLTGLQRLVVQDVLDHDFVIKGERRNRSYPTQTRLAKRLGVNRETVHDAIFKARELGYWELKELRTARDKRWKFDIHYDQINAWTMEMKARDESERLAREHPDYAADDEPDDTLPGTTAEPRRKLRRSLAESSGTNLPNPNSLRKTPEGKEKERQPPRGVDLDEWKSPDFRRAYLAHPEWFGIPREPENDPVQGEDERVAARISS